MRIRNKRILKAAQVKAIVDFVKKWRFKRFCTCRYIRTELKLKVGVRTIQRILNTAGYHWTRVPKQTRFNKESLRTREEFVDKYGNKDAAWWEANMNLVLDGVTLTVPPKPLTGRQKHAAQAVKHMWMQKGEKFDSRVPTYNPYGVQILVWDGWRGLSLTLKIETMGRARARLKITSTHMIGPSFIIISFQLGSRLTAFWGGHRMR